MRRCGDDGGRGVIKREKAPLREAAAVGGGRVEEGGAGEQARKAKSENDEKAVRMV